MSLKPINNTHSINKVILNLFLAHNFPDAKFFLKKINEQNILKDFQRKAFIQNRNIEIGKKEVTISEKLEKGIVLELFNSEGISSYLFKIENLISGKSMISFEQRGYEGFANLISKFKEYSSDLSSIKSFYAEAISLSYYDEFIWDSPERIDVENIFKQNNSYLNENFMSSKNAHINSVFFRDSTNYEIEEERCEVQLSNDFKNIQINHSYALKFNEIKEFIPENINSFLNDIETIHEKNKIFLRELLLEDIQTLIQLK